MSCLYRRVHASHTTKPIRRLRAGKREVFFFFVPSLDHGSNNVSRWMTWLPISLKNAAKCDKWYQLQNHSITESLNAKGAWEKLFTSHPRACRILSVEQKTSSIICPFALLLCFLSRVAGLGLLVGVGERTRALDVG